MANILICDDEADIVNALKIYLSDPEYTLFEAFNGKQALEIVEREGIQLVLLDIMMPEMDGMTTMVKLREKTNIPVILLTAKSEDADKILGLSVGADDYITKPFNPMEVCARVKSQLRRYLQLGGSRKEAETVLRIGGLELNDEAKSVSVDGEKANLTPTEYDILKLLMTHPGKVYSPQEIYDEVWKGPNYGSEGTVAVHIRHLREKIEINPAEPRYVKVLWGRGYLLGDDGKR